MVSTVKHPQENSIDVLKAVLNERQKYKSFYDRIKDDLITQAELFIEYNGDPSQLKPLNLTNYTDTEDEAEARKQSLIGLYSPKVEKQPYTQLENMRKHNGLVVCPSCGEPGRPRTLDHYLPKKTYPELAVLLLNLTPMCDWCQGEKLAEYVTKDGKKRYIHPYFDNVNQPLFSIKFTQPFSTPSIDIEVKGELPRELISLVNSHLEGIDFLNRFKEYFKTKYVNILRKAKKCRQPGTVCFRDTLAIILDMENNISFNSWDAVLYRSILEDDNLMDYLENTPLPDYL